MARFNLEDLGRLKEFLDKQLSSPSARAAIRERNRTTNYAYIMEQIRELPVGNSIVGTGIRTVDSVLYEILTTTMANDVFNNGLGVCQYEDLRTRVRHLMSAEVMADCQHF